MGHTHTVSYAEKFTPSAGLKKSLIIIIVLGVVIAALGLILTIMGEGVSEGHGATAGHETAATHEASASHDAVHASNTPHEHSAEHHGGPVWLTRFWAALLMNNFFFLGISLLSIFFIAINYLASAGWSAGLKRVPEAMSAFLPYAGVVMLVIFLLGKGSLYHWTMEGITDPSSPNYDSIIAGKAPYLNIPFFVGRMIIIIGVWSLFGIMFRKYSNLEDNTGYGDLTYFHKSFRLAAIFLPFFGVSVSLAAWDWMMSIDTHWYSTIYSVYCFATLFVSCMIMMSLLIIYLKENGYLENVNESHLHDIGKFIFAFSVFWAYIWLSQFLLIWYANIPEEVLYYIPRFKGHYQPLFFLNLIVNFVLPLLYLMTRDAKRKMPVLKFVSVILLVGHVLDVYLLVMPGTVGDNNGMLIEVGLFLVYLGAFLMVFFNTLAKHKLVPKNHPYLEESLHHNI